MIAKISAIFIDRDGTLNNEVGYLSQPDDVVIIPGAAEAIARLNAEKILVFIVTNQSGIGRGRYGWTEFQAVMSRIYALLAVCGAHIDGVYASPYHYEGLGDYRHQNHPDRKPNPGMLFRAAEEHKIDLSRSWMIGDKNIDLEAGHRAGCKAALVRTGYGWQADGILADLVADDLGTAVNQILIR